jgi:hypothetical protein
MGRRGNFGKVDNQKGRREAWEAVDSAALTISVDRQRLFAFATHLPRKSNR